MRFETDREGSEVFPSLRQDQRRTAFSQSFQDIVADHPIAILIRNQLLIEIVKLLPFVRIRLGHGAKRCGTNVDSMCERSLRRRSFRVNAMSHGATLHENDRMVPSLRAAVADNPVTYFAFARRTTSSKLRAERWWHSSTMM